MWRERHQPAVALLLGGLVVLLAYRLWTRPVTAPGPGEAGDLVGSFEPLKLDPETASAEDLEAVPGLGRRLAAAIVEHRTRVRPELPGGARVYQTSDDLLKVPGVSPAMVKSLAPYLLFPE
jgi:hypothetical protein